MAKKKGKRTLITALSVLVVLLLVIGGIALARSLSHKKDPYVQTGSSDSSSASTPSTTPDKSSTTPSDDSSANSSSGGNSTTPPTTPDPSTVSTIDIPSMKITVSYVKGIGPFEYQVIRAQNGTQYVQFSSSDLIGTKCTNDTGNFVSILANPSDDEKPTLSKTTTVDGEVYGLSIADATCTSDTAKLQKYQQSFSDAFSLLKKTN